MDKKEMLDLDAISDGDSLKISDVKKRLKRNFKDKKALSSIAKFKHSAGEIASKMQPYIDEVMDTPMPTLLASKRLFSPENLSRITAIEGVDILRKIPKTGGKDRTRRKIARLFLKSFKVNKFKLLKCLPKPKFKNLKQTDFDRNPRGHDNNLRNGLRGLKTIVNNLGYRFKFSKRDVTLIPLNKMP